MRGTAKGGSGGRIAAAEAEVVSVVKIRVFELAKAVGKPNAEVLALLQAGGMDVKSHSSSVDEVAARAILADRKGAKPPAKPTGAGTMQSGQIGRPQRVQCTPVSRVGCR